MKTTNRQYFAAARNMGFTLDYDSTGGGIRTTQFKLETSRGILEMQFWGNGHHRVSRMHRTVADNPNRLRGTTRPSQFGNLEQMFRAVVHELKGLCEPQPEPESRKT